MDFGQAATQNVMCFANAFFNFCWPGCLFSWFTSRALTTLFGIVLTKNDLFGGVAARGAGQVIVVRALLSSSLGVCSDLSSRRTLQFRPFSSARSFLHSPPRISEHSVRHLHQIPPLSFKLTSSEGPLILIGSLYQGLGFLLAFLVRQFFWVPHRFRYGILAAGTWGNWGDIRTSLSTCQFE